MSHQTADCCDEARGNESLRWADPDEFYGTGNELKLAYEPIGWYWQTGVIFEGTTGLHDVHVTRCPWCGGELPVLGPTDMPAEERAALEAAEAAERKARLDAWEREYAQNPGTTLAEAVALMNELKESWRKFTTHVPGGHGADVP